jgi:hypothetical protein
VEAESRANIDGPLMQAAGDSSWSARGRNGMEWGAEQPLATAGLGWVWKSDCGLGFEKSQ